MISSPFESDAPPPYPVPPDTDCMPHLYTFVTACCAASRGFHALGRSFPLIGFCKSFIERG